MRFSRLLSTSRWFFRFFSLVELVTIATLAVVFFWIQLFCMKLGSGSPQTFTLSPDVPHREVVLEILMGWVWRVELLLAIASSVLFFLSYKRLSAFVKLIENQPPDLSLIEKHTKKTAFLFLSAFALQLVHAILTLVYGASYDKFHPAIQSYVNQKYPQDSYSFDFALALISPGMFIITIVLLLLLLAAFIQENRHSKVS